MAKILLLSLVFSPDGVSTSTLMTELMMELKMRGHDITVLTTTPHYNDDYEAQAVQPLYPRWGNLLWESKCQDITVFHSSTRKKGNKIISRALDYFSFHIVSTLVGLTISGKYDLIIAPSPPLTIGLVAWLLGMIRKAPYIYNVQEIYPDLAVSLGIITNRKVISLLEQIENFVYSRARNVTVISPWFKRRLIQKGVKAEHIVVIPNFVDTEFVEPGPNINQFAVENGLTDKFVVLYAGNIGLNQNFENIIEAAQKTTHITDLLFLIVGDGARRSWLEKKLQRLCLPNVKLLTYQKRSLVPLIYASSSLCLVPLKKGSAQETFPSKIYTIMAASRPVLVAADEDSELSWVARTSGCGWAVPPDDPNSLVNGIIKAYETDPNTLTKMGRQGRSYVVAHHSKEAVGRQYDELIRNLV